MPENNNPDAEHNSSETPDASDVAREPVDEEPGHDTGQDTGQDTGRGRDQAAESRADDEPAAPDGDAPRRDADSDEPTRESPEHPQIVTTYERSAEGHRITRRTVHRSEVTEDTRETIEETYPVAVPVPYSPPTSQHPTPVG